MNAAGPIIDVTPITSSRTRVQAQDSKTAPGAGRAYGAYNGGMRGVYSDNVGGAYSGYGPGVAGGAYAVKSPSLLGSLAQIVVGTGLVIIGIPMLLLPGPGLLSIAAGGFLISRGVTKLRS